MTVPVNQVESEETAKKIETELVFFVEEGPRAIETKEQSEEAMAWLGAVVKRRKQVEGFFKGVIKPLEDAVRAHKAHAKSMLAPLNEKEQLYRRQLITFRQKQEAESRKEQARQNALYEKRMSKAEEKGKDPMSVKAPLVVAAPVKTAKVDDSQVTFKTVKKLAILDETKIPDEYWIVTRTLNKKMLEAALRAGNTVPGAVMNEEKEISVKKV